MPDYSKKTGLWHVGAYQSSGVPYVTSSLTIPVASGEPLIVSFPYVTKTFVVRNDGSQVMRLGYTRNGVKAIENNNYITLGPGISFEAEYRVSKLFLLSDTATETSASVTAGLTAIEAKELATNWSGSVYSEGVG